MSDDTLRMLRDSAADFATLDGARVRRLRGTDPGFERDRWREMGDMGWLGVLIPEAHGGLGLDLGAAVTIAEQLGRALYPEPYSASAVLATLALLHGDNAALKQTLLPRLASGEIVAGLAWQGERGGLDPDQCSVKLRESNGAQQLEGSSRFVSPAAADGYIVAARAAQGLELHWIARSAPGLACEPEARADGSASALLRFEAVGVSADTRVASPAAASAALRLALDHATLSTSAELFGLMDCTLEMTLDYLRTRVQFGKPIGSFQALQHRAVDMYMQKEMTRATLGAAVSSVLDPACTGEQRAVAASSAKARASQAALAICKEALQMHGAIGYTDEYDLGLYFNRALVLSASLGNASAHRSRYASLAALP
ncbi:MAG: acyl-CoA dehydrogenase family protein [Burkholderiales bacterium]|nr:acyl-CoA dehydrogenase family protein [Burkholderiales bacterium]